MATLFLFINNFNEQGYPCLVVDERKSYEVIHPLEMRDFNTIESLQPSTKTIVVLPCRQFSLHNVELPLLSEKKVRQALPYALEDNLAQPIEELHFSFDRRHFTNNHYLVAVCDQSYLLKIISQLNELSLGFDAITIDWFALNRHEIAIFPQSTLINDDLFQGALDQGMAATYVSSQQSEHIVYLFQDSSALALSETTNPVLSIQKVDMPSALWTAQRLLEKKGINLCQGIFQLKKTHDYLKHWYTFAAGIFILCFITFLAENVYQLHLENKEVNELDQKIAVIYRHFFPEAKQIINPRFRITQWLKSSTESNGEELWILLSKLSQVVQHHEHDITFQQLNWQNHVILITITTKDFNQLGDLENRLKQMGLRIKQTQTASKDKQVVSTLELSL